jgi:hypothetical protein
MSCKSWSSAQNAPNKNNPGEGPKAAPEGDKPSEQPQKAPSPDQAKPAQKS